MSSGKISSIIFVIACSYCIQSFSMIRLENFEYKSCKDDQIEVISVDLFTEFSTLTNLNCPKPKMDAISVAGIIDGYSTCGFDLTNSFKALLGKIERQPQVLFGLIQIGPLSFEGKEKLKNDSSHYQQVIQALKRAKIIIFGVKVYDTKSDFEAFAETFKNSLSH